MFTVTQTLEVQILGRVERHLKIAVSQEFLTNSDLQWCCCCCYQTSKLECIEATHICFNACNHGLIPYELSSLLKQHHFRNFEIKDKSLFCQSPYISITHFCLFLPTYFPLSMYLYTFPSVYSANPGWVIYFKCFIYCISGDTGH